MKTMTCLAAALLGIVLTAAPLFAQRGGRFSGGAGGFRPSSGGFRPGGSGFRPGGSTFRPGGSGFRPGGSGFRPGGSTFRPGVTRPGLRPSWVRTPGGGRVGTVGYARTYGRALKGGRFAYVGRGHRHWTRKHYLGRWRCWVMRCPSTDAWYFWCAERSCYLPVHYLGTVTPSQEAPDATDVPEADTGDGLDDLP